MERVTEMLFVHAFDQTTEKLEWRLEVLLELKLDASSTHGKALMAIQLERVNDCEVLKACVNGANDLRLNTRDRFPPSPKYYFRIVSSYRKRLYITTNNLDQK